MGVDTLRAIREVEPSEISIRLLRATQPSRLQGRGGSEQLDHLVNSKPREMNT
jgi:hypothetical protein